MLLVVIKYREKEAFFPYLYLEYGRLFDIDADNVLSNQLLPSNCRIKGNYVLLFHFFTSYYIILFIQSKANIFIRGENRKRHVHKTYSNDEFKEAEQKINNIQKQKKMLATTWRNKKKSFA